MRVEVPVPPDANVTLEGLRDAVSPLGAVSEREMVPENRPRLESVSVAVPEEPTGVLRVEVLVVRPKSGLLTVRLTTAKWDSPPLTPVTVIE